MTQFDQTRIESLAKAFDNCRVAVIGDLMLDRYMFGHVTRVSPEAPVPVVDIQEEEVRLGGAANVGHNIHGLGATPIMLGVVGDDASGELLKSKFASLGFPLHGIVVDAGRPTTIKTRVISGSQQMLRIDHELKHDISKAIEDKLIDAIEESDSKLEAIILEDYNKGVITPSLIRRVLGIGAAKGIPILVDPKFQNFFEYKNATLFKPNKKEVEDALGLRLQTEEDIQNAGKKLLEMLKPEYLLLTLGEKGMLLFERGESEPLQIPTRARQVADVSGAGDTVIATLAVALACGFTAHEAAILANRAAGLVIEEIGIVPIRQAQLVEAMLEDLSAETV